MIGSTRNIRVWAHARPADLRKGYDGLCGLVRERLLRDPLSGDMFLFVNRDRSRAKVLLWDGTGLCIYQKRLERKRFACLWKEAEQTQVALTQSELALFLEGSIWVGKIKLSPEKYVLGPLDVAGHDA